VRVGEGNAALVTAAVAGSAYFVRDGSGCDSETHSAAPLRSALTVSDSLGGARRVLALVIVVLYEVARIIPIPSTIPLSDTGRQSTRLCGAPGPELRAGRRVMATTTRPTLKEILETLRARLPEMRDRFGVRSLGVFGSFVRAEQKRGSDLDVLVEFLDRNSGGLGDLVDLERELSKLLGVKVDLVPRAGLKPYVGRRILEEVVDVEQPQEGLARLEALRAEGKLARPREIRDSLRDIRDSVENLERFTQDLSFGEFAADTRTVYAALHALMIIGEATRNLSPPLRRRYPDVPWRDVVGLRNIVAHAYFALELPRIWTIIQEDLPVLQEVAARILADLEREEREG